MKTIILIFLFALNLFPQNNLPLLFDDDELKPPMTNLQLYFIGDKGLTTSSWADQSGNNRTMTFYNTPTVTTSALNGIPAVLFNGSDEYGKTAAFTLNQPYTVYMMVKNVTNTNADNMLGYISGVAILQHRGTTAFRQVAPSNGADNLGLTANTYVLVRAEFNGASSKIQVNKGTVTTSNPGANNPGGISLAAGPTGVGAANIEVACILVYSGIPDTTLVKNYFTKKFGLP